MSMKVCKLSIKLYSYGKKAIKLAKVCPQLSGFFKVSNISSNFRQLLLPGTVHINGENFLLRIAIQGRILNK